MDGVINAFCQVFINNLFNEVSAFCTQNIIQPFSFHSKGQRHLRAFGQNILLYYHTQNAITSGFHFTVKYKLSKNLFKLEDI